MRKSTALAVLLLTCGPALADPTTPTPTPTLAPTSQPASATFHDLLRVRTAFERRTLVDAYDASGKHSPKYDKAARAFLETAAVRFAEANFDQLYRSGKDTSVATMTKLADALIGCQDPLVNVTRALIYRDAQRPKKCETMIKAWGQKVVNGKYPANRRYTAAVEVARLNGGDAALAAARDAAFVSMLRMPLADPRERQILARDIDTVWDARDARRSAADNARARQAIVDAVAADSKTDPPADPWVLAMLRGAHHLMTADETDGAHRQGDQTAETRAIGAAAEVAAHTAFEAAYTLEPTYAEGAARMIDVSRGQLAGVEQMRMWFDRAIGAQIDLRLAWNAETSVVRPGDTGSLADLQALAVEAAATRRYDTWVPFQAVRMVQLMQEEGRGDLALRQPGIWPLLAGVYDGYCVPPARNVEVAWMQSAKAAFAYKCGAYDDALKTLDALGEKVVPEAMTFLKTSPDVVRAECGVLTGPHGVVCRDAERDEQQGDFARARDAYDAVLVQLDANDPARPVVLRRRSTAGLAAALQAGGEAGIPLDGPDDLCAFTGDRSGWHVEDGVLTLDGKPNSISTLQLPVDLPARSRMRVEFLWSPPKGGQIPGLEVLMQETDREGFISFHLYPRDNLAELIMGPYTFVRHEDSKQPTRSPPDTWHSLEIVHDGNTATVTLNNDVLIEPIQNNWLRWRGRPMFGLRVDEAPSGGTVKFRNLSIEALR